MVYTITFFVINIILTMQKVNITSYCSLRTTCTLSTVNAGPAAYSVYRALFIGDVTAYYAAAEFIWGATLEASASALTIACNTASRSCYAA